MPVSDGLFQDASVNRPIAKRYWPVLRCPKKIFARARILFTPSNVLGVNV
jgi:hypothetical protein